MLQQASVERSTASKRTVSCVWTEWFAPRLMTNSGEKERFKPTMSGTSHPMLKEPAFASIRFELAFRKTVMRGEARRNSNGQYFLRGVRLKKSWPRIPNSSNYRIRFTAVGVSDE